MLNVAGLCWRRRRGGSLQGGVGCEVLEVREMVMEERCRVAVWVLGCEVLEVREMMLERKSGCPTYGVLCCLGCLLEMGVRCVE